MADEVEKSCYKVVDQKHTRYGRTWRRRKSAKEKYLNRPLVLLEADYIELLKWAKQNGVVFGSLRPAIFNVTGRGMMATRRIQSLDDIISVPKRLLITPLTALQSAIGTHYQRNAAGRHVKLSNKCLLCVYLVYLKYLGKESFWHPYITTLPKDFNTSCYFNDMELNVLPKSCYKRSLNQINEVKQAFEKIQQIFGVDLNEFDLKFWRIFTYESFRWAWSVVNTRSVYLDSGKGSGYYGDRSHGDNYALAPVLDLLNHNDTAEIHAEFHQNSKAYKIHTLTEYRRGHQVFINYGPHDNTTLLIEYGFILPKNIHNSFKFEPSQVYILIGLPSTSGVSKKLHLIRKNGFEKDFSCSDHGISWSLQTALRILALHNDELDQWTKVFDGDPMSDDTEQLVHQWKALLMSITLETLGEEDAKLVMDRHLTINMQLALELRKQEKEILQDVFDQLGDTTVQS